MASFLTWILRTQKQILPLAQQVFSCQSYLSSLRHQDLNWFPLSDFSFQLRSSGTFRSECPGQELTAQMELLVVTNAGVCGRHWQEMKFKYRSRTGGGGPICYTISWSFKLQVYTGSGVLEAREGFHRMCLLRLSHVSESLTFLLRL